MFTDSYKHMECLGGMMLQSFLMVTLFTRATPGTPASIYIIYKGLQCALTAITIVALWQLPHLGAYLYAYIYAQVLKIVSFIHPSFNCVKSYRPNQCC